MKTRAYQTYPAYIVTYRDADGAQVESQTGTSLDAANAECRRLRALGLSPVVRGLGGERAVAVQRVA